MGFTNRKARRKPALTHQNRRKQDYSGLRREAEVISTQLHERPTAI